jgi:hypothetical protein
MKSQLLFDLIFQMAGRIKERMVMLLRSAYLLSKNRNLINPDFLVA